MLFHLAVFMCASTSMPLILPTLIFLTSTLALVLTLVLVCDAALSRPLLLSETVINTQPKGEMNRFSKFWVHELIHAHTS